MDACGVKKKKPRGMEFGGVKKTRAMECGGLSPVWAGGQGRRGRGIFIS